MPAEPRCCLVHTAHVVLGAARSDPLRTADEQVGVTSTWGWNPAGIAGPLIAEASPPATGPVQPLTAPGRDQSNAPSMRSLHRSASAGRSPVDGQVGLAAGRR